jgi:hypothetical protein
MDVDRKQLNLRQMVCHESFSTQLIKVMDQQTQRTDRETNKY